MVSMSPEEVRAYLSRWELVRKLEVAELRRASPDTKLKQLEVLVASRHLFSPDSDDAVEQREIQERWAKVRQALGA